MNDTAAELERFVAAYLTRGVPPPHILLVGPDEFRNASVAAEFAQQLGMKLLSKAASEIETSGDLTGVLWGSQVSFLSNIHRLKKPLLDRTARALLDGEFAIVIGQGHASRTHRIDLSDLVFVATCPTKYDCPPSLLKVFEKVLSVEPPTEAQLKATLINEALKDHISLDDEAADLFLSASGGRTELMLAHFRRARAVIEQIKTNERPILLRQEVADALERLRIKLPTASNDAQLDLQALSGQEFENVIKVLLTEMGFEAELTEVTGDGGIDIIARLDKPFVGGRYLFQCKRYAKENMVGAPEVRDFYGAVMADRAVKGIFITTSDFTMQAKDFASQSGIELVNLVKLQQLLQENNLNQYVGR